MSRCTGKCCRAFVLNATPEKIDRAREHLSILKSVRARGFDVYLSPGLQDPVWIPLDAEIILPMLVPLVHAVEGDEHPADETRSIEKWNEGWYYTCTHFDAITSNCMIYETRPHMCRDYPYGRGCDFQGCSMDPRCTSTDPYDAETRCTKNAGHDCTGSAALTSLHSFEVGWVEFEQLINDHEGTASPRDRDQTESESKGVPHE